MDSIKSIENRLKSLEVNELRNALDDLKSDERNGVIKIIDKYNKKINKYEQEIERLRLLNFYENKYFEKSYKYIAGVDEVGRGPLAGPVVAACVVFPKDTKILNINDSKKLSENKRNEILKEIKQKALYIGIGICSNEEIDRINILQATFTAMKKAINNIDVDIDMLLIDGDKKIPNINIDQETIIKGDSKSISIAAASIVAKVFRDDIMYEYHKKMPVYNFASNKGYGTSEHINAIKINGYTEIHRKSFIKKFI